MKQKRKKNTKGRKEEGGGGGRNYSERVRAKWFCCAFKLSFLQLICKASLIFKSNLELALSIRVSFMSLSMLRWSVDV